MLRIVTATPGMRHATPLVYIASAASPAGYACHGCLPAARSRPASRPLHGTLYRQIRSAARLVSTLVFWQNTAVRIFVTAAEGTVDYTLTMRAGLNWIGPADGCLLMSPAATLTALAPGYPSCGLAFGTYSATIQIAPSDGSMALPPIPFRLTVNGMEPPIATNIAFGNSATVQHTAVTPANPCSAGPTANRGRTVDFTAAYVPNNLYFSPLPAATYPWPASTPL
jgi:hypothetical protein